MLRYYKHYIKSLAIENKEIAHTTDKPAYFFVKDKYNPDAFDRAIKSALKLPALLLEPYTYKGNGNGRNYRKTLQCRFSLLIKTEAGKQETIDSAYERCELLAEDIMAKMREDLEEGGFITIAPGDVSPKVFLVEEFSIEDIGPVAIDYYGVTVGFELMASRKAVKNPANWN